ncbi:MAG: hypothetical protein K5768_03895 [Firmicutes bacterium]|nr:hypothetical protein [Bacillota bacterium]
MIKRIADFCTALVPDSDEIEPTERSSSGETFGAWKKSKTVQHDILN